MKALLGLDNGIGRIACKFQKGNSVRDETYDGVNYSNKENALISIGPPRWLILQLRAASKYMVKYKLA